MDLCCGIMFGACSKYIGSMPLSCCVQVISQIRSPIIAAVMTSINVRH
jgi:hypothetical protein